MPHRSRRPLAVVLTISIALAACAGSDDDGDDAVLDRAAGSTTIGSTTPSPTGAPAAEAPSSTRPPKTAPSTDVPVSTDLPATTAVPDAAVPPPTPAEPGEIGGAGAGEDELYPELGNAAVDVQHYDLRLAYDTDARTIDAHVTLDVALTASVDEIVLDATDIDIAVVAVAGQDVAVNVTAGDLLIPLAEPTGPLAPDEALRIEIAYQDRAASFGSDTGLEIGWFATDGGSYVLNEPDGASTWLPSNDHPADKATWHFEITVPSGVTAVANGELADRLEAEGSTTWIWEQREPMSTYLIQLLTGDYQVLDDQPYRGVAGSIPIVNVALTSDVERMQPYFDMTGEQMAFFEPLFGRYPLDRYGLAFTDSFGGLAMETQGRSLFSRDDFTGGEPDYGAHLLTSHELAHQWFGNAVSPADWGDLWLNESLATYGEWLWLDHVGQDSLEQLADSSLEQRQFPTEPTGTPTVERLFGFERYDGGAVVVHALRRELGDDAFFELLQRWVADNHGGSRTTEDFIALAEEIGGRDLGTFFDDWLFAPSVPDGYPP